MSVLSRIIQFHNSIWSTPFMDYQQMYIEPVENLRDSCSVAFSCCVMKLGIKNIEKWTFALSSRCQIPR